MRNILPAIRIFLFVSICIFSFSQLLLARQSLPFDKAEETNYDPSNNKNEYNEEDYSPVPAVIPTLGLVAWYPFNANTSDESGNNNNLSSTGATLGSDRFGNANSAYVFSGSSYLSGSCASFPAGNNQRTISLWYNANNLGDMTLRGKQFFGYGGGTTGTSFISIFENQSSSANITGKVEVQGHGNAFLNYTTYPQPATGTWHNLIISYNGSVLKFYIDGVMQYQSTATSLNTSTVNKIFCIGKVTDPTGTASYNDAAYPGFNGSIDDVAIWSRALSDQEISVVSYSAVATNVPCYVPTNGLVAWYPLNGNALDYSGHNDHATSITASPTADRFGNTNAAYSFSGYNYISGSAINFPTGARSISFWYNALDFGSAGIGKNVFGYGSNCGGSWINIFESPGSNLSTVELSGHCNTFRTLSNIPTPANNTWHHLVFTYDGTTIKIYTDGNLVQTTSQNGIVTNTTNSLFFFGTISAPDGVNPYFTSTYKGFTGKLDDLGTWERALSLHEIQNLFQAKLLPPQVTDGTRCGSGPVTLTAIPNPGETIDWYAVSTGGAPLATASPSYNTSSLDSTRNYYAEIRNTSTGCVSFTRSVVKAIVRIPSTSTISVTIYNDQVPYSWNGSSYSASGTYSKVLTNSAGCDSTAILKLTVLVTQYATGYTNVETSVGENGQAVASIKLNLPKGNTIEPDISIVYNSHSPNSFCGNGVSIDGLFQVIAKTPATYEQDKFSTGSNINDPFTGRYTLNGERLMATFDYTRTSSSSPSDSYLANTLLSVTDGFRTEQESFSKIVPYASSHPEMYGNNNYYADSFRVYQKNGTTLEFGCTPDSRVGGNLMFTSWLLNRIIDKNGNYLDISYYKNDFNGEFYPREILYTGNRIKNVSPYNRIAFRYENRPDSVARYIGNTTNKSTKRLIEIAVYDHNTLFRKYLFKYAMDTVLSKLIRITEYGIDSVTALKPVSFTWKQQPQTPAFSKPGSGTWYSNVGGITSNMIGDFNADGKMDIAGQSGNGVWNVSLSTGSGFVNANWFGPVNTAYNNLVADFNGDGKADIAGNWNGIWQVGLSTGKGFINDDWSINTGINYTYKYALDVNADGKSDIACYKGNGIWHIFISTGSSFTKYDWSDGFPTGNGKVLIGDFNGDGKSDIAAYVSGSQWNMSVSNGDGFGNSLWNVSLPVTDSCITADMNQDGLTDIVGHLNGTQWLICTSIGGFFQQHYTTAHGNDLANNAVGDFNKDGYTDLATYTTNSQWNVYLGNGNGFRNAGLWYGQSGGSTNNVAIDVDGDGASDLVGYITSGQWNITLSNAENEFVTDVQNGNGYTSSFSYAPITKNTVYQKDSTGSYPNIDFCSALNVVDKISSGDGVGGIRSVNYKYANAKFNVLGRGFRGFEKIITTDSLSNTVLTNYYNTDFKSVAARLSKTELRTVDNRLLHITQNTIAIRKAGYSKDTTYFSYYSKTADSSFDINSGFFAGKTTDYTTDGYGNVTQESERYNDGYSVTTNNTYTNQTTGWLLGLLTESVVTRQMPGKPAITRNKIYSYDPKGNLIQEVNLPAHASLRLQTDYAIDSLGNTLQTTLSGPGIPSRTENFTYDAEGLYLLTDKNALNHIARKTYKNSLPDSMIDANGLVTTVARDAFGRETTVTNKDGTVKTITYNDCSTAPGSCPTGAIYFTKEQSTGLASSYSYFDVLDRVIRKESESFGSNNIVVDIVYNPDGTTKKETLPYFKNSSSIYWTEYQYDSLKRISAKQQPYFGTTRYTYNGLAKSETNPIGQKKTYIENAQGKLVKSIDYVNAELTMEYDADLNGVATTDPNGNKILTSYDLLGNKTYMKDPDMGVHRYEYNSLSLLTKEVNPKLDSIQYEYDLLNRMVKRTEPLQITRWVFDSVTAKGLLYQVLLNDSLKQEYGYDSKERINKRTYIINGRQRIYTSSYDAATGLLASLSFPNNISASYIYLKGFLKNIVANSIRDYPVGLWTANNYNEYGVATEYTAGNALKTTMAYDPLSNLLTSIKTIYPSTSDTVQNLLYEYSQLGDLLKRSDAKFGVSESFAYDNLHRLIQAKVTGQREQNVQYDVLGNITFKSDVGNYHYGENGKGPHTLTSIDNSTADTCAYSFNQAIRYNSYNYVSSVSNGNAEILYRYGPDRDRQTMFVKKNGQLVQTKNYYGDLYEETISPQGDTIANCYLKYGQNMVAVVSGIIKTGVKNDSITYLLKDHLGSAYAYTDEARNVRERISYDAWGKPRNPTTWQPYYTTQKLPSFQRGYTFHEMMDMDFLICMNARVYNPVLGRFLTPDPFVQSPDNLQSFNRFSYVLNNPLSYTDPTGYFHWKKAIKQWAPVLVGAIISAATAGLGVPILSGAAAGFGSGFTSGILNGQGLGASFRLGLQAGIQGGLTAGLNAAIDKTFLPLLDINAQFKSASAGFKIANQLANSTLRSAVSGVFAERNGGSFKKSFLNSMFWEGIGAINSEMIINYTAYDEKSMYSDAKASFRSGKGVPEPFDKIDKIRLSRNPNLINLLFDKIMDKSMGVCRVTNDNSPLAAGNWLSRQLNMVPGLNNHANVHDAFISMFADNSNIIKDNSFINTLFNVSTQITVVPNYGVLLNQTGMLNMMQNPIK